MSDATGANPDWMDGQWITPGQAVLVCRKCGSWVPSEHAGLHADWHEHLRRAVDEAETLD